MNKAAYCAWMRLRFVQSDEWMERVGSEFRFGGIVYRKGPDRLQHKKNKGNGSADGVRKGPGRQQGNISAGRDWCDDPGSDRQWDNSNKEKVP
ncbi:UNVERIFIED_CONTAM: hypothetical protein PYX00_009757 [Menopon gallinae]|uniref:Uncharacterized protein n=1 Tax=Menopon gallinae TaxID=328185 RepID=A0AAW2HCU8_9NEOP